MVHGFGGSGSDLRLLKNLITQYARPEEGERLTFLLSNVNSGKKTEGCIFEMGTAFAHELKQHIEIHCPDVTKISFFCFSLGGLIARAAFPLLQQFRTKFHLYCSLGSPHLGYMYN
jgi:hypothetical protein